MKLIQKKMPVSVRFRLNPVGGSERLLQYMITVDGRESPRRGVMLDMKQQYVQLAPREWNQEKQKVLGSGENVAVVNKLIAQMRFTLLQIHADQWAAFAPNQQRFEQGDIAFNPVPRPTYQSVLFRFREKREPWVVPVESFKGVTVSVEWAYKPPAKNGPLVLSSETDVRDAMTAYLLELRVSGRRDRRGRLETLSPILLGRFDRAAELLRLYQRVPLPVGQVTAVWANNFHSWLQAQPATSTRPGDTQISMGLATRHTRRIRELIAWLHEVRGVLPYNPLAGLTWTGYETKEVEWLDEEQLQALEDLPCAGTVDIVRWWCLIMAYTGLDFPDARNYVVAREEYEVMTPEGPTIQGNRCKPPHASYCIPRLNRLDKLFERFPAGPRALSPQKMNAIIRDIIAPLIGFTGHLTIKTMRKSAGAWFLEAGLNITEVSRVLGHTKIQTTEMHYTKASVRSVTNGMKRTGLITK